MSKTIVNIPATGTGAPTNLNMPMGSGTNRMEPSGLTIALDNTSAKKLFMVSDNGGLAMMRLPFGSNPTSNDWTTLQNPTNSTDKSDDYECVCYVPSMGDKVLIGVEGYRLVDSVYSSPKVRTYDISSGFKTDTWTLALPTAGKTNSGMEAMTSLNGATFPSDWSFGTDMPILTAVQAQAGKAYVYSLPTTPPTISVKVYKELTIPQPVSGSTTSALISEMFFDKSTSILYVLYDGGGSSDYLQALQWHVSGTSLTLSAINVAKMPWIGCEGMVVDGNDLYFSTDNGQDTSKDGVYLLSGFISGFINP